MVELKRQACFIGGQWVTGERWLEVEDPATGRIIGRVPDLDAAAAETAVEAARAGQPAWAALTALERSAVLRRIAALMTERLEPLAALLTEEQGKPLGEARREVMSAAAFFDSTDATS